MPTRTNSEIQRILKDIRSLREQDKNDNEIRDILKLPLRTYQRYLTRINKSEKEIWYNITANELESNFLRLLESLEFTYQKAKELSQNGKDVGEILEALDAKDNARLNIIRLILEGLQLQKIRGPPYENNNKRISLLTK